MYVRLPFRSVFLPVSKLIGLIEYEVRFVGTWPVPAPSLLNQVSTLLSGGRPEPIQAGGISI